jgi:hypothetical protein
MIPRRFLYTNKFKYQDKSIIQVYVKQNKKQKQIPMLQNHQLIPKQLSP